MQGDQAGRAVGHVGDHVLRIDLAVVHALHFQLQNVRHLVRGHQLGPEGEERGEILDDRQVAGVALHEFVALQDGFLRHVEDGRVAGDYVQPVFFGNVSAVFSENDAQFRFRRRAAGFLQFRQTDVVSGADEGVCHLEEAAGEPLWRRHTDVAGVIHVVQADAEDAAGVAVQGAVDDFLFGDDPRNALQLLFAAVVIPLRERLQLLGLDQIEQVLFPNCPFRCIQAGDGQNALYCYDAGSFSAVKFYGCQSHYSFLFIEKYVLFCYDFSIKPIRKKQKEKSP